MQGPSPPPIDSLNLTSIGRHWTTSHAIRVVYKTSLSVVLLMLMEVWLELLWAIDATKYAQNQRKFSRRRNQSCITGMSCFFFGGVTLATSSMLMLTKHWRLGLQRETLFKTILGVLHDLLDSLLKYGRSLQGRVSPSLFSVVASIRCSCCCSSFATSRALMGAGSSPGGL